MPPNDQRPREKYIEENETEIRKFVASYLSSVLVEKWQTFALVDQILEKYSVMNTNTTQAIISNAYQTELGIFRADQASNLSKSQRRRLDVFCQTAAHFIELDAIKAKIAKAMKEDAVDACHQATMTSKARKETDATMNQSQSSTSNMKKSTFPTTRSTTKRRNEQKNSERKKQKALPETIEERIIGLYRTHGAEQQMDVSKIHTSSEKGSFVYRLSKSIIKDAQLELLPTLTADEHSYLSEISDAKTINDADKIRAKMMSILCTSISPSLEFIRTALHQMIILSIDGALYRKSHGEDWYRINVYANMYDNIFLMTKGFESLRAEMKPTIAQRATRSLRGVDPNDLRLDFIFQRIDGKVVVFATEDKNASASNSKIIKDEQKCDGLRISMLEEMEDRLGFEELIDEVEAITAQWHGLQLTIRGTKKIGGVFVHYTKKICRIPADLDTQCATFAEYLMTVVSLKRAIMLNFCRCQVMTETRKVDMVKFLYNNDVSDSPDREKSEDLDDSEREVMQQLLTSRNERQLQNAREAVKDVTYNDTILIAKDWQFLTLLSLLPNASSISS
ncbi:hypothetical protein BJV82DRAFT_636415 [Fennellomyces sp. T-0311]|nr:hypothetical protein BJV82DRAFT_636415 [Fennellomyces sp. T-0311]